jgi:hypothetical protein
VTSSLRLNLLGWSDADLRPWQAARTIGDLGQLTASWLEGSIPSHPAVAVGFGPDPETTPLLGTLAAVNRAGLATVLSQPGQAPGVDSDGALWEQRAAVEAFIAPDNPLLQRLLGTASAAGVQVMSLFEQGDGVVVSRTWGRPYTRFGRTPKAVWCCSPKAAHQVAAAVGLLLIDPSWDGSDRLWCWLDDQVATLT